MKRTEKWIYKGSIACQHFGEGLTQVDMRIFTGIGLAKT
jgi:hypothetical protein